MGTTEVKIFVACRAQTTREVVGFQLVSPVAVLVRVFCMVASARSRKFCLEYFSEQSRSTFHR
eukprot:519509-Amphidinium_carterae.4